MPVPTETLPKQAGDSNANPAYFDQAKKLKQDKNLANNVGGLPPATQAGSTEAPEAEPQEEAEEAQPTQVEYQPFPLNPEEENSDSPDNQEEDNEEKEGDEQQQEIMQAQLEQARQLALLKARAEQVQAAKLAENIENEELVEIGSLEDVKSVAAEQGSQQVLDWSIKVAPAAIIDLTGVSLLAAGYLNLHIIGHALGFSLMGLKLSKPKIWHYIMLILVDLEIIIAIIVILFLLNLLVYIGQHPFKTGWEVFKEWIGK